MPLRLREQTKQLHLGKRLLIEDSDLLLKIHKLRKPLGKAMAHRIFVLRTLFQMLPGRTFEEKQAQYRKVRSEGRIQDMLEGRPRYSGGIPEYLGIRSMKRLTSARGGYFVKSQLDQVEQMAGIEKLWPFCRDALEELAKGEIRRKKEMVYSFDRKPHESEQITPASSVVLSALEAAGIIQKERGCGKRSRKILGFRILDPERFSRTRKTGYVQWPELAPHFKGKRA